MSEQGAKMVLDRWIEDESFRQRMREDPIAAVEMIDADLDDQQRESLRSLDWTMSDAELQELLEKGYGNFC